MWETFALYRRLYLFCDQMKEQICDKCAGGHSMEWDWRFLVYSDLSINSKK
ncbi:hypothetical protein B4109_1868 [Geobacillus stearothermophilus]|uniref:Uncharacterized protein n=1 Tax=Geobacillus stearothermophilus TaxID=1422 RepID=A0A150M5C3_GEOSE|nr:hypothetical protein B4109_1868 [Geobacillus stearothermophilus]